MKIEKLTKETAKNLIKIRGETRGVSLRADWEVILKQKGERGIKKLEAKMAELGYPLKYKEIKVMEFYPIGLDALSVLAIAEVFDFDEKKIEEMGAEAVKVSLFLKIFMKYFLSIRALAKEAPRMWRRHFTIGSLELSEINEKEKRAVIRLKDFALHSLYCASLRGYFAKILKMTVRAPVTCQETKCVFRGDVYHEFSLSWK